MNEIQSVLQELTHAFGAAELNYMIAGSFASTSHGVPRTTQDIDVVVDPHNETHLLRFLDALPSGAYYFDEDAAREAFQRRSLFNLIHQVSGWKVDVIVRKRRRFSASEFQRRIASTIDSVPVFIASAEDTIVAKLEWSIESGGSSKQRADIQGILRAQERVLDQAYLQLWIGELELQSEWDVVTALPTKRM